ncbi:N-acetylglucosamine-6-phosphate deacetylase [Lasiodiplodia theobromae]|uniref:N-acetylglucosamine-6-phosphate deacetylase n=1 Tax=Lasiodiplodia theobromae TaxID=45133 RepID=A0A5N5DH53_9PEZI|nr:N-acetylglucosamine-6-phosphate deacetylase [Lasiodiplodia theobromae]KAB2577037.1 N-acetylglucosamine-6-phosphate deacetylase [Lasiodiplodia theobromae]KAF4543685.1 N-acetylglucosamine-6-phosphate deacetylase [Lasiodiplodia theobromae]
MPIATSPVRQPSGITKFTNCRIVKDDQLVYEDLWFSSVTGKVLRSQEIFYEHQLVPDRVIDLGGRIVSPGFLDVQLNGGFGFDFSVVPDDVSLYAKGVLRVNKNLITTGVTSYLPTLTSQKADVYHKALPFLGPSGLRRNAGDGAESLGAHCEGPFMSPTKNGIHNVAVLRTAPNGIADLEDCYGAENMEAEYSPIRIITLAPELPGTLSCIPELKARGIDVSIGHSEATFEEATAAMDAGAKMITHLFNAMRPLHHRNPGIFGLLGTAAPSSQKPFFGLIADGIHLHSTTVKIAWHAHPDGMVLVTDAMALAGLEDGTYEWTNGSRIVKRGPVLTQEETGRIAGSAVSLIECVNNFLNWTGATIPQALKAVTATPARMLGLQGVKGSLQPGADADLVVLDEEFDENGTRRLRVDQVWKFGEPVFNTLKMAQF